MGCVTKSEYALQMLALHVSIMTLYVVHVIIDNTYLYVSGVFHLNFLLHQLFLLCNICVVYNFSTVVSMSGVDPGCILCIHGYSQHIRQKLKENQYLLLLSS